MKLFKIAVLLFFVALASCSKEDNGPETKKIKMVFTFTHNWDGTTITMTDLNKIQYTNAKGDELSIEKLRYLISDITLHKANGKKVEVEGYVPVDISRSESLTFQSKAEIPMGDYENIAITFGFDQEDNVDGKYKDLNTALWNVPEALGGGYHYMQFEGKFIDNGQVNKGFQYHAIRAVDKSGTEPKYKETFIEKNLGSVRLDEDSTIEIKMNVAEWFKNPNVWDLNALHSMMMPNYNAQLMINENGQNVFSIGKISQ